MAFAVDDFEDLIRLLDEHPEWRQRLRANVLGHDFEELPAIVRDLAEAQRRTEARVEELAEAQRRTEAKVEELAEAQRRTEARLDELGARVADLAEAQRRTEARLDEFAEAQRQLAEAQLRTEETLNRIAEQMEKSDASLAARMDSMMTDLGYLYEIWYRDHVLPHFGQWLRKPVVVRADEIPEIDDALEDGRLSEADFYQLSVADMIIRGIDKPSSERAFIAVEVSRTVNPDDVSRAIERAAILRAIGLNARAAVGGQRITDGAQLAADEAEVLVSLVRDIR